MLPLELIRRDPDSVRRAAALKGEDAPVDRILELDRAWREATTGAENARARQNQLSQEYGKSRDASLLDEAKSTGAESKRLMSTADELRGELDQLLLRVPNLFHESVPVGETEADNVELRTWGEKPQFPTPARPHWEVAGSRMDFERATKVAGARFTGLVGPLARLERALIQFMLDVHTEQHGYTEIQPPFLVNSASMTGTANLPKFGAEAFRLENRDLWLIPTAEVPVTNWHRDEILDESQLPLRYVAYTPCWRSEAGAAGRDTRGYIRQHQFQKVEMVKLTTPGTSMAELDGLLADAEDILQRLGLHYRVLLMCSGDMGFAQYKKFDIEAWAPGLDRYLEVSSCSVFADFQARRANLRYRPAGGGPIQYVHTINGSGLATVRTISAILETYQEPDGSVRIPEVLRPYMAGQEMIRPPA